MNQYQLYVYYTISNIVQDAINEETSDKLDLGCKMGNLNYPAEISQYCMEAYTKIHSRAFLEIGCDEMYNLIEAFTIDYMDIKKPKGKYIGIAINTASSPKIGCKDENAIPTKYTLEEGKVEIAEIHKSYWDRFVAGEIELEDIIDADAFFLCHYLDNDDNIFTAFDIETGEELFQYSAVSDSYF